MAQSSDDFPASLLGGRGRGRYDWPTWADGQVWHMERGQDFGTMPSAFAMAGRQWAARNGKVWEQRIDGDHVWFRMTKDESPLLKSRGMPAPSRELPMPYDPNWDAGPE